MHTEGFKRVVTGGILVDVCSEAQLVDRFVRTAIADRKGARIPRLVFDVNGHAIALAAFDKRYRAALLAADIVHADGQSIVWASKLFCNPAIPERTATTDLIHAVGRASERNGIKVFLLGSRLDIVTTAAKQFVLLYPNSKLVGFHHGYFNDADIADISRTISAANPDIVFVGLGKPREQYVCLKLSETISASWLITAGGCFDFLAGNSSRAPVVMRTTGFEWFYRLLKDPRRLAWRYLWTNLVAIILLFSKSGKDLTRKS